MATPHPALDAAVQQFAQQPGVSPADVAALRAALSADPDVSQRLDAQAAGGALHGFALAAAGAPDRPVGNYDHTAGTVTLPSSAFSGPHPDVGAVLCVQAMVAEFGAKSYTDASGASQAVTPDMLNNLQGTLNNSPVLAEEIKRAATTTDPLQPSHRILESFAFTAPGAGVGGSFNAPGHAMNLVSESLMTRGAHSPGTYNPHDLTFVIGHEVQHGWLRPTGPSPWSSHAVDAPRTANRQPGGVTRGPGSGHRNRYAGTRAKALAQNDTSDDTSGEVAQVR